MAAVMCQVLVSLLVLLTLTQDSVWGQQRYKVENDPFGGIRYSNSRVASTEPRKPPSSNRTSSGYTYRRPVTTSSTTTSTTTEVPRTPGPWDAYTTQTPRIRGRYDAYTTTTTTAYPRGRWDAYTTTSTTPPPPRPVSYREDPYRSSSLDSDSETVTKKPRRRKLKPIVTDDSASSGIDSDKKQQWRTRYGSWKKNQQPNAVSNRLRSPYATTAANTEGHGIEEGSYFERSNTSTPGPLIEEDRASHFDWETTKKYPQHHHHKKHHRNHHHHRTTTTTTEVAATSTAAPSPLVQPDYSDRYRNRDDGYSAFESRSHSYSPSVSTSTTTTLDPFYDAPVTRSTLRPYRRRTTTTTARPYADSATAAPSAYTSSRQRLSSHVAPSSSASLTGSENAAGSATYHQKLRRKPTTAIQHRSSESVSYVAGSYFPMSAGNDASATSSRRSAAAATLARKPTSGFAVRPRGSYDADPVTPSPLPTPVYPTVRIHYFAEDTRDDDDEDDSGGVRQTGYHHHHQQQQTGRRSYQDEVDNRDEDYSHPFASLAGNYYPS